MQTRLIESKMKNQANSAPAHGRDGGPTEKRLERKNPGRPWGQPKEMLPYGKKPTHEIMHITPSLFPSPSVNHSDSSCPTPLMILG
jgi:hypothetical protein